MTRRLGLLSLCFFICGISSGTVLLRRISAGCASGGNIGTTTHNTALAVAANSFRYSDFTPNSAGTVTHCWGWTSNNTGSVTIGIYETDGTLLVSGNNSTSSGTGAWSGGALDHSVCLVAGHTYYVGLVSNDASFNLFRRDTMTGITRYQIAMTYGTTLANADFSSPTINATNTGWSITCNDTGTP